jgi:hypothetical protein
MADDTWITRFMPNNDMDCWFWIGAVRAVLATPALMESFRTETGRTWTPGRTTIDRLIDDATGADRAFFEAFLTWFNAEVWGTTAEGQAMAPLHPQ